MNLLIIILFIALGICYINIRREHLNNDRCTTIPCELRKRFDRTAQTIDRTVIQPTTRLLPGPYNFTSGNLIILGRNIGTTLLHTVLTVARSVKLVATTGSATMDFGDAFVRSIR